MITVFARPALFDSVDTALVPISLVMVIGSKLVKLEKSIGKPTASSSGERSHFLSPRAAYAGQSSPEPLSKIHMRHKLHDVAFMLRALRAVVKDKKPKIAEGDKEPLTKRFSKVRVPEDRKVRRHCRHNFVSYITYLSKVAQHLDLSTMNDLSTLLLRRRKGMCFKESRQQRVFCNFRRKRTFTLQEVSKKSVSSLVKKSSNGRTTKRKYRWTNEDHKTIIKKNICQ